MDEDGSNGRADKALVRGSELKQQHSAYAQGEGPEESAEWIAILCSRDLLGGATSSLPPAFLSVQRSHE